ncbi:maleylpyruvate isomerase family mycothiol-dependent enzyme [Amycolatopsis sp. NBC_01286]|uniref:maleylpyruvate isomerase family mycothiol-dependent enzyme n=1 Tax=Amycolatopsis sp. NBC_01286 TaxID=2903560 RepID=UPI002E0F5958|nr:maleylpyruvate isomerase family mycothiol-dependent enzyme [Amycolatopsis sp. NBC_01286]
MIPELNAERCRLALEDHVLRLAKSAVTAGARTSVPTCPDWTVKDLVQHVGQTLHWVSELVERRVSDPTELPGAEKPKAPKVAEWQDWLSDAAARAVAACSDEALADSVFNAADDKRTGAEFWLHSLLNEAVIHGYDAAAAAGDDYDLDYDLDAATAADLITNHLAMLTSPTWEQQSPVSAKAIRGGGEVLHWHATDEPGLGNSGEWYVERYAEGTRWDRNGTADVTVSGQAKSLLFVMTRRIPLTGKKAGYVITEGKVALAEHWLKHSAHVSE